MNEHDSERIANLLVKDGYSPTDDVDQADVVVLNTCCIRENADTKLYGNLGHLKAAKDRNQDLQIVVAGCLAQKDRDEITKRASWVDVVVGTHNISRVPALLADSREYGTIVEILEESAIDDELFSLTASRTNLPFSAYVTVQVGCDNNCAFCIVPAVRGKEVSRKFGDILAEVERLAAEGVTEITLLGQNVNSYGRDLAIEARRSGDFDRFTLGNRYVEDSSRSLRPLFSELLRDVSAIEGIERVRFTSPHPKDIRPETIATMAEVTEVMNQLHFPLQAGSDRILAMMHRGYTAERYLTKLAAAREAIADLAVTTDIIVGFPSETEDDFEATLEVAARACFDSAFTFIYSPRPGTEASLMVDQFIDPEVVQKRFDALKVVVERSALLKHEERIGRVEKVLVEGPSKKHEGVFSARTSQNKLVHFGKPLRGSDVRLAAGSYALVEITSATPHFLRGELVDVIAAPRHRRKIEIAVS